MKSYSERRVFSPADLLLFHRAQELVNELLVHKIRDKEIRCHELARFVAVTIASSPLPTVDGNFGLCDHSWIALPAGNILDVYKPGQLPQVQLIDPFPLVREPLYRTGPTRTDIRHEVIADLHRLMADYLAETKWGR